MGLDTTHGCWHGAYSAFTRWRQKLAEVAGYHVWDVRFSDGVHRPTVMIDWGHVTEANLEGAWASTPADPLLVLIAHSDYHGVIWPEQARPLADRIESLIPLLPPGEEPGHIGDWRVKTQKFVDGLRQAAEAGEPVRFH